MTYIRILLFCSDLLLFLSTQFSSSWQSFVAHLCFYLSYHWGEYLLITQRSGVDFFAIFLFINGNLGLGIVFVLLCLWFCTTNNFLSTLQEWILRIVVVCSKGQLFPTQNVFIHPHPPKCARGSCGYSHALFLVFGAPSPPPPSGAHTHRGPVCPNFALLNAGSSYYKRHPAY
jgi:hypothetical protein